MSNDDKPRVIGVGRSVENEWFARVRYTVAGSARTCILAAADVERPSVTRQLGLLTTGSRQAFGRDVERALRVSRGTFRVVARPGWHGPSFVLPNGEAIPALGGDVVCLPPELAPFAGGFEARGRCSDWGRVARLALGNPWMMVAIATAFVGPVALLLDVEAPVIQFVGEPSTGKSTVASVAASVIGAPTLSSWDNTSNNLPRLLLARHGTLIVLDETKLARVRDAATFDAYVGAFFAIAEGSVKGRLTDERPPERYCVPVIATSNESLDQLRNRVGGYIDDAHRGRIIDIPVDPSGRGAVTQLHGLPGLDAFLRCLRRIVRDNHGVAFLEFLRRMAVGKWRDDVILRRYLSAQRDAYLRRARQRRWPTSRDLSRVHNRMATIYAAGALAIEVGILPWRLNDLGAAVLACEVGHVDLVGRHAGRKRLNFRPPDPIRILEAFMWKGGSRLLDLRATGRAFDARRVCVGESEGRREYWLSEALFRHTCGGRAPADRVKRHLDQAGLLASGSGRHSTRRVVNGQRLQLLAIRANAFDAAIGRASFGRRKPRTRSV